MVAYGRHDCGGLQQAGDNVCKESEGEDIISVFTRFYSGAYVTDLDPGERAALDRLYNASYIDIRMVDGREYAEASALGRQFKLRDRGTKKRRCAITLGRWIHECVP